MIAAMTIYNSSYMIFDMTMAIMAIYNSIDVTIPNCNVPAQHVT